MARRTKFKYGDIVVPKDPTNRCHGGKGIFRVIEEDVYTGPDIVIRIFPIVKDEYYEHLQYQRHFKKAGKAAQILYGKST